MQLPVRTVYFIFGWIFFSAGFLGVFLPVLPTTPFMLLALWMFSQSSERFHNWLYEHRVFGPPLQRWFEHRVVPPIAKLMSISMMALSFAYVLTYTAVPWWGDLIIGSIMLATAWYILSKPSYAPEYTDSK